MEPESLLEKMKSDWDRRARENPRVYIANGRESWSDEEFAESGDQTVRDLILNDLVNICQGRDPKDLKALEIGCGAGRVTRALAGFFGEVHAVDVSGEMVKLARSAVRDFPNAHIYQNNGRDLSVVGDQLFDFAFSMCVFHHIPSKTIIESYISEVGKRLRPGCLFKFEVQGFLQMQTSELDTWLGTPMSESAMREIAERCGFEARYSVGAGEERFWLWFFKKP